MTATQARTHLGGAAYAHPELDPLITADLQALTPHPDNPRNGDTDAITESIRTSGMYRPIYVQRSTGRILAGNHTYAAALQLGAERLPVVWLDVTNEQALRILIADNRTADLGTYDDALLAQTLTDLTTTEAALLGTGYTPDDLDALMRDIAEAEAAALDAGEADDNRAPTTGEMLAIADVTWGEPTHHPHHGDTWAVGPHLLVIAKVHDEHHLWRHLLTDDMLLCPYPEPYLTCGTVAEQKRLLLVQPNVFLAGHLLDKHHTTHPDDTVARTGEKE